MFLKDRVAIVTAGGGPGMGRAFSMALAREGAAVVIAEIDAERARKVEQEVVAAGGRALAVATDVSRKSDVERMVRQALERFGRVDILSNHAGISTAGRLIENIDEAHWDRALAVHLKGTFLCSQAVLPHMKAQRWGRIVNTSSRAAYRPTVIGLADYAAAKAGIIGFSRAMAMEVGAYGITVNCIAPGLVSGSGMGLLNPRPAYAPEQRDRAVKGEGQLVQPVREMTPDEIAGALLYLVGPSAERVTGMVMHVNGGSYLPS
ncbi:MAG: SDR family NAD(P)-dependent oxidoreductase [Chloroflexi bacterium]|nr:SDR family NAD(P)-dependent oxidoreductase [Chloroflexota bacterium]